MADLYTDHHRAVARELTYAAGVPLRDRYGYAASDEKVDVILAAVFAHPGSAAAAAEAFGAELLSDPLAMAADIPTDEAYELRIAEALHPLVQEARHRGVVDRG